MIINIKAIGHWVGEELVWTLKPNYGAFCIKEKDLRRYSTRSYFDLTRACDVYDCCKAIWKLHKQNKVFIDMIEEGKKHD